MQVLPQGGRSSGRCMLLYRANTRPDCLLAVHLPLLSRCLTRFIVLLLNIYINAPYCVKLSKDIAELEGKLKLKFFIKA